MEPVKISLADAAKQRGCSVDYLLALAEAGQIRVYARIGPHSGEFKNRCEEPPFVTDACGGRLPMSGQITVREPAYTTLLPQEAALLRTGNPVPVWVVREPGAESGVRFPFSGEDEFCLHLTERQLVGVDQVCVIEEAETVPTSALQKPVQRAAAQRTAILAEIRALGWNPQDLPLAPTGMPGARARVYQSMVERDKKATRAVFSSKQVFDTAWQRLRDEGAIAYAPALGEPQKNWEGGGG